MFTSDREKRIFLSRFRSCYTISNWKGIIYYVAKIKKKSHFSIHQLFAIEYNCLCKCYCNVWFFKLLPPPSTYSPPIAKPKIHSRTIVFRTFCTEKKHFLAAFFEVSILRVEHEYVLYVGCSIKSRTKSSLANQNAIIATQCKGVVNLVYCECWYIPNFSIIGTIVLILRLIL